MPTIVRKTGLALTEVRRDVIHAVSWQARFPVWSPPTDEYETEDAYTIRMEIAGMREEDFEVAVENSALRVSGFRPDTVGRRAYHQMEIRFGKFSSVIPLPGPVNVEKSSAEYQDGFLTVTLIKENNKG